MATTAPAPSGGGKGLMTKVGPLPVIAWIGLGVVIYLVFLRKKSSSTSTASTTGTTTVAPTPTATITYPTGGSYTGPVGGAAPPVQGGGGGGGGTSTPGGTGSPTPGGGASGPSGPAGIWQTAPASGGFSYAGTSYTPISTYQQTLADFSSGTPVYFRTTSTGMAAPITETQYVAAEHGGTHKYTQYTSYARR